MIRVRPVHFIVTPVLVADDGEHLAPIEVQPVTVSAADWPTFAAEQWPALLEQVQAQVDPTPTGGEDV